MRYGAGVDDVDIRAFAKIVLHIASRAHLFANGFTIGLIYFAAECGDCKSCCWQWMVLHIFLRSSWYFTSSQSRSFVRRKCSGSPCGCQAPPQKSKWTNY